MPPAATELICTEDRYAHKYFFSILHYGLWSGPGQDAALANATTLHFGAQILLFPGEGKLFLFPTPVSSRTRQHRHNKIHSELIIP